MIEVEASERERRASASEGLVLIHKCRDGFRQQWKPFEHPPLRCRPHVWNSHLICTNSCICLWLSNDDEHVLSYCPALARGSCITADAKNDG